MSIGQVCNREFVTVLNEVTVLTAAQLMRQNHVGEVVIVEEHGGKSVPVGILTDHDVVVKLVATELDAKVITVGDISARKLVTVKDDLNVLEAVHYMHNKEIRRLSVVNDEGELIGIVTLDDLLHLPTEELSVPGNLVQHEDKAEVHIRH